MYSNVLKASGHTSQTESFESPLREPVCAGCRYSQVFAVQPRTVCVHPSAGRPGRILCAGEPGCAAFVARSGPDLSLNTVNARGPAGSPWRL